MGKLSAAVDFPVADRDPRLPVWRGVPCGGSARSAQGFDGEPDNSVQPGARGVKPATAISQHTGGVQSVGPQPGRAASEAGGDVREITWIHMTLETEEEVQSNESKVPDYDVFLFFLFRLWVTHALKMEHGWAQRIYDRLSQVWKPARQVSTPVALCVFAHNVSSGGWWGWSDFSLSVLLLCFFILVVSHFMMLQLPHSISSVLCPKCNLPQNATHVGISYPCIVIVLNFIYLWILL